MSYIAECIGPDGFGNYAVDWTVKGPQFEPVETAAEVVLVPGFVDVHIHGAFGIDFMTASAADLSKLSKLLGEEGYEGFFPTTVTASAFDVAHALDNLPEDPRIWGVHLEGPFISEKHPGAQPLEFIVSGPPGEEWHEILTDERLKFITLAPERNGGIELIAELADRGVLVSLGHSHATFEEARAAAAAGATRTTHTFNAMRGFHHREAGLAGFAMLDPCIYTELIYDRLHVSRAAAELLIVNKPEDKVIAVSDSTMATRLPPGQTLSMWGQQCITAPGEVRLSSNGALAGSAITLLDAFRNLYEDFGGEVAMRACSLNPREELGIFRIPLFISSLTVIFGYGIFGSSSG